VILFVSGTGTEIGKTVATAALAACASGTVAVVKPVQTGVASGEPGDLTEVTRLSGCADVHEFARYPHALAPHHAAAVSGLPELELAEVVDGIGELAATRDLVLVEGAGGLLVPFASAGWSIADVARSLAAPVLIVTAPGLGTLHHTSATLRVLRDERLDLAGLVIGSWPAVPGLAERRNIADLAAMDGGLAGVLPEGIVNEPDFRAAARPALAPSRGGSFDSAAFVASVVGGSN
jgi:dethiobiotin synthetase